MIAVVTRRAPLPRVRGEVLKLVREQVEDAALGKTRQGSGKIGQRYFVDMRRAHD
jgi:hypothetical protein